MSYNEPDSMTFLYSNYRFLLLQESFCLRKSYIFFLELLNSLATNTADAIKRFDLCTYLKFINKISGY